MSLMVDDAVTGFEAEAAVQDSGGGSHEAFADVVDPWGYVASAPFFEDPAPVADLAMPAAGYTPTETGVNAAGEIVPRETGVNAAGEIVPREEDFLLGTGGTARRERVVCLGVFLSRFLTRSDFPLFLLLAIDVQAGRTTTPETSSSEIR
jgi:hypothetical protein